MQIVSSASELGHFLRRRHSQHALRRQRALRRDMAEEPVPAVRQRKKRKWDQPAEAFLSPAMSLPLMQFGGANTLATFGMPNMMSMMTSYMGLPVAPVNVSGVPTLPTNTSAAAIVQKINQELIAKGLMFPSKVHDEVISREIVINDADPGVRYKLTKRQTQEEIQSKTGAVVITRGRFRPPNGPPDLEKPLYLHISAGVQLKDTAERIKAVDAATALVEEMMKQSPPPAGAPQSAGGGQAFSAVVNVGIEADPSFNLIGRIRGPNDQYMKHIMTETGADVSIRGRGSGSTDPSTGEEMQQPLHLFISSENAKSVDDAQRLSENLLDTIRADNSAFRPASLLPVNGPPPMYNHGAPKAPDSMGQYAYQQASGVLNPQVGFQDPRVQFQASVYLPGSQPETPGSFPQAAAPTRNLMDPYANMRPPSKSYSAVPPPQQLRVGGALDSTIDSIGKLRSGADASPAGPDVQESTTTSITPENSLSVATSVAHIPVVASTGACQPPINCSNYRPQNMPPHHQASGAVAYSNPSYPVPVPTPIYGGYGGVYPQVSPLQQVTQVLQRPPLPVTVRPGHVVSGVVPPGTEGAHSSSRPAAPVQRERRKFQEFPVAAKNVPAQVSQLQTHQTTGLAWKQDAIGASGTTAASRKMPPPPPKFIPPPPPKFSLASETMPLPKPAPPASGKGASEPEQDGLKLVEYGEEDDDEASEQNSDRTKAENPCLSSHRNGKPFWAAP